MTNPKRYDMENVSKGWDAVYKMVEGPDGDYVTFEDYKVLRGNLSLAEEGLANATQEIHQLRTALGNLTNGYKYPAEACEIARKALSGSSEPGVCACIPLAPRPAKYCSDCGGRIGAGIPPDGAPSMPEGASRAASSTRIGQALTEWRDAGGDVMVVVDEIIKLVQQSDSRGAGSEKSPLERTYPDHPVAGIYEAGIGVWNGGAKDEGDV